MKKLLLSVFLMLLMEAASAQVAPLVSGKEDAVEGMVFSFRNCFNGKDWMTGVDVGWTDFDFQYSITAAFEFRPFRTKVLTENGANQFYQFREKRFLPMFNAEKFFKVVAIQDTWFGSYFNLGAGYYFGDYKGTRMQPKSGFDLIPSAGVMVSFNNDVTIHAGAEYLNARTTTIRPFRFALSVNFHPDNN